MSTPLLSADVSLPSLLSAAFAVLLRLRPSDSSSQGSQDRRSRRRHVGPQAARPPCYAARRSEEHTSELQSLMRISYAVFCLKKKKNNKIANSNNSNTETNKNNQIA